MIEIRQEVHFQVLKLEMVVVQFLFGAEAASTANLLDQKVLTITDSFEINSGINKITIGTHNEFSSSKNVFFI